MDPQTKNLRFAVTKESVKDLAETLARTGRNSEKAERIISLILGIGKESIEPLLVFARDYYTNPPLVLPLIAELGDKSTLPKLTEFLRETYPSYPPTVQAAKDAVRKILAREEGIPTNPYPVVEELKEALNKLGVSAQITVVDTQPALIEVVLNSGQSFQKIRDLFFTEPNSNLMTYHGFLVRVQSNGVRPRF
ncbi:MAG: hypothetical protein HY399_05300 [Elusimicrobia bacterium]|nr:hypothetical protein [Elusimicrobiota bacterium]